jgi:hypothetical protein
MDFTECARHEHEQILERHIDRMKAAIFTFYATSFLSEFQPTDEITYAYVKFHVQFSWGYVPFYGHGSPVDHNVEVSYRFTK